MLNEEKTGRPALASARVHTALHSAGPGREWTALSALQAVVKGVTIASSGARAYEDCPAVIFHATDRPHNFRLRQGDRVAVEAMFPDATEGFPEMWAETLDTYLSDPYTGRNFDLVEAGRVEVRDYGNALSETGAVKGEGEICLEFLTPFPFNSGKSKSRTSISKEEFVRSFERRLSRIFGTEIGCDDGCEGFTLLPYYWNYTETKHLSKSQPGHTQYLKGCVGRLYIKGNFRTIIPYLVLGRELHCGTKLSNAQGYYRLHWEPPAFFGRFFPDRKAILSTVRDVIDRYDDALGSLSVSEGLPFDEARLAEDLYNRLADGSYTMSPDTAFTIKKKDGSERIVERLCFRDIIVCQYVLKTISPFFERMFEEGSIGSRRGISRQEAVEMVRAAVEDGYRFVMKSDVDDFFPSIDLSILAHIIDGCLPGADTGIKGLLSKTTRNGHILNGAYHERTKGLAQGNPLSPLLANLYLDYFDERMQGWGVRMVRYVDDFIILTKTKEEAESVLSKAEASLTESVLSLDRAKTSISPVADGFEFLGMRFGEEDADEDPDELYRRQKKPLYVTEPYTFLSLNGDALDIKRGGEVVETLPIRRLSEIMVMEKASLSTALLRKCADSNIPLTITLNSGYYITTVKPDSKKYYDVSFEHGRKYSSLSETELLMFAKEFAAGKLTGYASLFRQKQAGAAYGFAGELDRVVKNIHAAGDVQQVRGFEGAAAKKTYVKLNGLIDNPAFHIKKRDRRDPDRVNSLLNFGYYLLFSRVNATVRALGLNPYLGFLHSPEDNYESLVCDIEELFRARIDRLVVRLVNLKTIRESDFTETGRGLYLTRDAAKKYLYQFEAEMDRKKEKDALSMEDEIYIQTAIFKKWALESGSLSFYNWRA